MIIDDIKKYYYSTVRLWRYAILKNTEVIIYGY